MARIIVPLYTLIEQFADLDTVEAVKKKCRWEQMTILAVLRNSYPDLYEKVRAARTASA
jgi:hypothetical protein